MVRKPHSLACTRPAFGVHSHIFICHHSHTFMTDHIQWHLPTDLILYHSIRSTFTFDTTHIQGEQHTRPTAFIIIRNHTQIFTFERNSIHVHLRRPPALIRHYHNTTTYTVRLIRQYTHATIIPFHSTRSSFSNDCIQKHTRRASFSTRIAFYSMGKNETVWMWM